MITACILSHPQSADLLKKRDLEGTEFFKITCGTTKLRKDDDFPFYSESNDFFPSYASWNSSIFESSVILTIWEHMDKIVKGDYIAILHTDIEPHFDCGFIWGEISKALGENENSSVALTVPFSYKGILEDWLIPEDFPIRAKNDPMLLHAFDNDIHVWEFIKKYDPDAFAYAMDVNPRMIYSHQFACSVKVFDRLGEKLFGIASNLRLGDIGFWSPHMFERLIAIYLAMFGEPILSTAFWHHSSSGTFGPGEQSLYGPRALRFYNVLPKYSRV